MNLEIQGEKMSYERKFAAGSCFLCDEQCQVLNLCKKKDREKVELCVRYHTLVSRFLCFSSSTNMEKAEKPLGSNTLKSKVNFNNIFKKCKSESTVEATTNLSICETCFDIASAFCDTFFKWSFLELQLYQKTKEIAQRIEKVDVGKLDTFRLKFLDHARKKATKSPELKLRKLSDDDDDDEDDDSDKKSDIEKINRPEEHWQKGDVRINQKETLYKCVMCGDEFLHNKDFLEHLQIHYSQEEEEDRRDGDLSLKEESDHNLSETEDEDFEFETLVPDGMVFNREYHYTPAWQVQGHENETQKEDESPGNGSAAMTMTGESKNEKASATAQLQCQHCGRTFAKLCHLMNHMRVHRTKNGLQGDGKFRCCFCDKIFVTIRHLKNHSRMHRPSKLDNRVTRFSQRCTRNSQKATLHNMKTNCNNISCRFCDKEFKQGRTTAYKVHCLREHMPVRSNN